MLGTRGGYPKVVRASVSGTDTRSFGNITNWLQATTTADCRMYFNVDDYTADTNYVLLQAAAPFNGPAAVRQVWLRGTATVTLVGFCRL